MGKERYVVALKIQGFILLVSFVKSLVPFVFKNLNAKHALRPLSCNPNISGLYFICALCGKKNLTAKSAKENVKRLNPTMCSFIGSSFFQI